jgi:hypothetical protein
LTQYIFSQIMPSSRDTIDITRQIVLTNVVIFIFMKVAMWTLEPGLGWQVVEVAPVSRPVHLRVCGRKKSPDGVLDIEFYIQNFISVCETT